jgi:hypothetical protein
MQQIYPYGVKQSMPNWIMKGEEEFDGFLPCENQLTNALHLDIVASVQLKRKRR